MTRRRLALWLSQVFVAVLVGAFVWRTLQGRWEEFRRLDVDLTVSPAWIGLAAVIVLLTYALLIDAWRRVLAGWRQPLGYAAAVRIWTLSNLARYVPGKIWSVAGMALLSQRAGVAGWAAAGSAVVLQALAVGTGVALVAATVPGAASPVWLGLAAGAAAATVAAVAVPGAVRQLGRLAGGRTLEPLALPAVIAASSVTLVSWLAYGVAFWCLARGLLGAAAGDLTLTAAVGVFAGGYITGLIALFAPGGIGVREVVLVGLLTPALGGAGAVVVTVGSRVLLTLTEIGAALVGLILRPRESAARD